MQQYKNCLMLHNSGELRFYISVVNQILTNSCTGLIISISLILAAGFAVYENPHVRQWVDESRRKIAIALHSLGDEIGPSRSESEDASTREDDSPEAVERRRRARQEILERGRMMEEKRRAKSGYSKRAKSFDDMVDDQGRLKIPDDVAETTATDRNAQDENLRHRMTEANWAAKGATMADPFADETHMDFDSIQTPVTADVEMQPSHSPDTTMPELPPEYTPQGQPNLTLDTDAISSHPSELLVDLTPTTSHASNHNDDLSELAYEQPPPPTFYSVNEWAEHSSASFYSPPQSEVADHQTSRTAEAAPSETGTGELVEDVSDGDVVSDVGDRMSTPESWTEVGSQVSENE